ncbi:MAG TPA: 2OG-Fe(II) oxygenase, partial [Novosphingobium sp.]|nr:2OG-Fe(II) oxygenase [Novosphingobium sp.]
MLAPLIPASRDCTEAPPMTAAKAPAKDGLTLAERRVLADIGRLVRERLDADPGVHRIGVDGVDLYAVSDFLSASECERLIGLIDAVAQPSPTYPGGAAHRTSWSGDFDPADPFVKMIERRIADLIGIEETWAETMQG